MDLRKAFKEIFKCYITQNMLRFENIDLSLIKTANILATQRVNELRLDQEEVNTAKNILSAFDYIDHLNLNKINIDLKLYKDLNERLAHDEALEPGQLRACDGFIPCVDHPIERIEENKLDPILEVLNDLDQNAFKNEVSDAFSILCKMQPFYDGNKRSSLFLCNIALFKKDLGILYISPNHYQTFEDHLTKFYQDKSSELIQFLENNCVNTKQEFKVDKELTDFFKINHKTDDFTIN